MSTAQYQRALMIFRRDVRLEDNTALAAALRAAREVVACFIFDPRQAGPHAYRSAHALQFMLASLCELGEEIARRGGQLYLWRGEAEAEVVAIARAAGAQAVFFNRDYTPFSRARDAALERACATAGIHVHSFDDALLHAPGRVMSAAGTPYTVFTAYFRKASTLKVPAPQGLPAGRFMRGGLAGAIADIPDEWRPPHNPRLRVRGGRREALAILARLAALQNYAQERDIPARPTTGLSAHIKFGTVSLREVHAAVCAALGPAHVLIKELHWHDFFTHIGWHFPHVFGHAFHRRYDALSWSDSDEDFAAWCEGRTGFPIVDAGMRELNTTGFMHNRVRMIVASFLTKDLVQDWRRGERYFAQQLVDYDACVNNGNWQWSASTGCDAQPYFRIFNPWLQQKKFDPRAEYIVRWVPELAGLAPREIHDPRQAGARTRRGYPAPMCNHTEACARAKARFAGLREMVTE